MAAQACLIVTHQATCAAVSMSPPPPTKINRRSLVRVGGMTTPLAGSAFDSLRLDAVPDQEALRRAYELPGDAAVRKQMTELTEHTRRLIGCSSLVLIASADSEGNCDVSPRGGPAGFVAVLDARTVAIPDATGNKRLDTLQNVIATGRAGLLFVIPGRTTTLRVNGRAVVSTRPDLLSQLTAVGKPPASALVLGIEEVYPHCPAAAAQRGLEARAVAAGGRPADLGRGDTGPTAHARADDRRHRASGVGLAEVPVRVTGRSASEHRPAEPPGRHASRPTAGQPVDVWAGAAFAGSRLIRMPNTCGGILRSASRSSEHGITDDSSATPSPASTTHG